MCYKKASLIMHFLYELKYGLFWGKSMSSLKYVYSTDVG